MASTSPETGPIAFQNSERLETLFLRCTAIVRRYFSTLEEEYGRPAVDLLLASFKTRPIPTLLTTVFCLYAFIPVVLFISTTIFIAIFAVILALSAAAFTSIMTIILLGLMLIGTLLIVAFLTVFTSAFLVTTYISCRFIAHVRLQGLAGMKPWFGEIKMAFISNSVPPSEPPSTTINIREEENSDLDVVSNPDKSDEDIKHTIVR